MPAPPPPFPSAVEARIKFASITLLAQLRTEVAAMTRQHRQRLPGASHAQLAADIAAAGRDAGRYLRSQNYRQIVLREAQRAARQAAAFTSRVVGWRVPVATDVPAAFTEAAWDKAEEEMDGMADCMAARLNEWLAGAEFDLDKAMQECLDRSSSRWYAWLSLMLGWMAGGIITETYKAAGVTEAEWVTREDRRVRPAHHALDGERFSYSEAPPLKAGASSNGQDCWPGDDYGCRCVARPVAWLDRRDLVAGAEVVDVVAGGVEHGRAVA